MAEARAALSANGWREVASYGHAGSFVFEAGPGANAQLEAAAEHALRINLGLVTEAVVRTAAEWRAAIAANPFPEFARDDPAHLVLMTLKAPPRPDAETAMAAVAGRERVAIIGGFAYICYPEGIAGAPLIGAALDRALGARGTGRNWKTALALAARAEASA